jgi:hypothetical protein
MDKLRKAAADQGLEVPDHWSCECRKGQTCFLVHGQYFGIRSLATAIVYLKLERDTVKAAVDDALNKRKREEEEEGAAPPPQPRVSAAAALQPSPTAPAPVASAFDDTPPGFPAPAAMQPAPPVAEPVASALEDTRAEVPALVPPGGDAHQDAFVWKVYVTGGAEERVLFFKTRPACLFTKVVDAVAAKMQIPATSFRRVMLDDGTGLTPEVARTRTVAELGVVGLSTLIVLRVE